MPIKGIVLAALICNPHNIDVCKECHEVSENTYSSLAKKKHRKVERWGKDCKECHDSTDVCCHTSLGL